MSNIIRITRTHLFDWLCSFDELFCVSGFGMIHLFVRFESFMKMINAI